MNDPKSQNSLNETSAEPAPRQPWQPLDFEKIAASDAENATPPGGLDGAATYS